MPIGERLGMSAFHGITAETQRRWRVSVGDGALPRWRGDGKELYYITSSGRIMSVSAETAGSEPVFGPPQPLFSTISIPKVWNLFDVARDGNIFLVKFVGRADECLNYTLKNYVGQYKMFKFSYALTLRDAFEKECRSFHEFNKYNNLENKQHPEPPKNIEVACPLCQSS